MKRFAIILVVSALVGFALYRYGGLVATFETGTDQALIKDDEAKCKAGCMSQSQWAAYCNAKAQKCSADCDLLLYEGKTQADVNACKQACEQQKARDLAAYKDKASCEAECAARAKALLDQYK